MQCHCPFIVKDKIKGDIPVPCGRCYACVMRRISGWHFRLSNELKYAKTATFLTLTYNDDFLPASVDGEMTLHKPDLQNFFKRLRYYQDKNQKNAIRYYAVGEYGSKTDRPHYHAILFNADYDMCVNAWRSDERILVWRNKKGVLTPGYKKVSRSLGNAFFGDVTDQSIGYVTGYIQKSFYKTWEDSRQPPFACMSKYLGINYLSPSVYRWHKEDLTNRMYVNYDGKKLAMPRYFKNLIYDDQERELVGFHASKRAEELETKRWDALKLRYGDRAAEINFEHLKAMYKKLQNKKQKRK